MSIVVPSFQLNLSNHHTLTCESSMNSCRLSESASNSPQAPSLKGRNLSTSLGLKFCIADDWVMAGIRRLSRNISANASTTSALSPLPRCWVFGFSWWDPQPSHVGGLDVECGYVQEKKKDILDFNDMIKEKVPTEVLGAALGLHQCLSLLHKAT